MDQMVLVFETALLDRLGRFQGASLEVDAYLKAVLDPTSTRFMHREAAEQDPRFKQLIPYVVLRHGRTLFSYVRGKRSTESRLHARRSIGLGGHIEPADRTLFRSDETVYREAARREVEEEVELNSPYAERIVGLLNDDSTEVGRVHFGIVHLWDLAAPLVRKREGQITQAGFRPLDELRRGAEELESWSRLTLEILADPRVPPARAVSL